MCCVLYSGPTAGNSWSDFKSKEPSISTSHLALTSFNHIIQNQAMSTISRMVVERMRENNMDSPEILVSRSSPSLIEGERIYLRACAAGKVRSKGRGMMEGEELQIDLGAGSGADPRPATEAQSGMTWLQAAEHVLMENGGPGMHIRDLTRTILELGIVRDPAFCYGGGFFG